MKKAGIKAVECYLPERVLTNDDITAMFPRWDMVRAERLTGIRRRHVEDDNTPASEMACRAASKLFAKDGAGKDSVDFVIVVTQSGDYRMPATACILQNRLGLSRSVGAMDINQGCAGYVYGLMTAKALVECGAAKKILLITVEKTSFFMHPTDATLRTLQGDAATATLVSSERPLAEIGDADFGTDGGAFDNIIVPYGGSAEALERKMDDTSGARYQHPDFVNMKGMEIFNFSVTEVPETINAALGKNGLAIGDVDYFILHQANAIIIRTIAEKLKIPPEKIPMNIDRVGNTSSCSIPLLLSEVLSDPRIKRGDKILLCGFGVGLSWATTVLRISSSRS
jgi:3-oxoacyl-[acyl-carrier-protein] synthase-3